MNGWRITNLRNRSKFPYTVRSFDVLSGYIKDAVNENGDSKLLAVCPDYDFHHYTLGLVPLTKASAYIHIDAHPDDAEWDYNMGPSMIGFGSFVHFLPEHTNIKKIRMIGPSSSWYHSVSDYVSMVRCLAPWDMKPKDDRMDMNTLTAFLSDVDDAYLSIDLDILLKTTRVSEIDLLQTVKWIARNKKLRGADIYPGPDGKWAHMVKPIVKTITSS